MSDYCMVLTTCGNKEEAEKLAGLLLRERLAACVQMTAITSFYEWKKELNKDEELLLLMKTRVDLYDELEKFISTHHSYEEPEIVRLPIEGGSAGYLGWIDEVTGK